MKRLLILTALLMLASSAIGCRCCDWLWRGAAYRPYPATQTFANPCDPCENPCGPAMSAPGLSPGPG